MPKAIAYIRYSSDGQKGGSTIERQNEIIQLHAQRNNLEIAQTFIDDGYSASTGKHLTNGNLGRILTAIDGDQYRGFVLLVEKMDRFSRLGIDETQQLTRRIIKGGVQVHLAASGRVISSLDDLPTAIMDIVESHAAKAYTDNLSANIQRGKDKSKDKAANEGWIISRSVPIWLCVEGRQYLGNKIVNPGKIVIVEEWAENVREIYRLAALGLGAERIAHKMGDRLQGKSLVWVMRLLQDPSVTGEFTPKGRPPILDYYPIIISRQEFEEVRSLMRARRLGGKLRGGNTQSHLATNLFSALVWDTTDKPIRQMHYQHSGQRWDYLLTKFEAGRKQHRVRYQLFEGAFLGFLKELDWQAVAGQIESAAYRTAQMELHKVLSEVEKVEGRIIAINTAMEANGIDAATLTVLATRLAKDEALIATLNATKEVLQTSLEAARASCHALYTPQHLLELIRGDQSNDIRLRLRMEIKKRVERVGIQFFKGQTMATIVFVNGIRKAVIVRGDQFELAEQLDCVRD